MSGKSKLVEGLNIEVDLEVDVEVEDDIQLPKSFLRRNGPTSDISNEMLGIQIEADNFTCHENSAEAAPPPWCNTSWPISTHLISRHHPHRRSRTPSTAAKM